MLVCLDSVYTLEIIDCEIKFLVALVAGRREFPCIGGQSARQDAQVSKVSLLSWLLHINHAASIVSLFVCLFVCLLV